MSSKSAFLPRISLQRDSNPVLPFHNPTTVSVHKKPSEYDLSELSPRPDDASPYPQHLPSSSLVSEYRTSTAPSAAYSDRSRSMSGSPSKTRASRVMFAGPPPPIAASRVLYRDEEENHRPHPGPSMSVSTLARNINSVLFDRGASAQRSRDAVLEYEPDTVWRNLQRRERKLQKELQLLLDAQSVGLAGNLDPAGAAPSDASDAGSSTPTSTLYTSTSTRRSHILFEDAVRSPSTGEIVPVRQPRKKPLGLRAARAGIAKNIALLADIKAEEDANLSAALSARKKALAQLRKLAARRDGIADELQALEGEEEEPLALELRELGEEHGSVTAEIAELEERLMGLRNRRRRLDTKMEDVRNRREAGLSGYKGALKEVEGKVAAILTRPPVRPLDPEVVVRQGDHGSDAGAHGVADLEQSSGGLEFLRMRPERRTVEMARDWWESEVAILERRKKEVEMERTALEEGVGVWRAAYKLVSDYEADLRREMRDEAAGGGQDDKGKGRVLAPEEAMRAQLAKMSNVMATLQQYQQLSESKGWNLLICAIGAEHAAFGEARAMLRATLRSANIDVDGDSNADDGEDEEFTTPQLGRSASNLKASALMRSRAFGSNSGSIKSAGTVARPKVLRPSDGDVDDHGREENLVDLREDGAHQEQEQESDNEVPADLLVGPPESPALSRADSENAIPPEFLAQHL